MKTIIFISFVIFLTGCQAKPELEFTDKYIRVVSPGALFMLNELGPETDSATGYPLNRNEYKRSYTLVSKESNKTIAGHSRAKVYFGQANSIYGWKIMGDPAKYKDEYLEPLTLKEKTWYYLLTANNKVNYYFYLKEPGKYILKEEPNMNQRKGQ